MSDIQKIDDILSKAEVFYLATVDGDKPKVRPLGFHLLFEDKISLQWQEHTVTMLEIPGHSLGSIGIYVDESDFFSGDSLFKDFEIELHLPGGSVQKWEEIGKKRIEAVPCGTKIWPGHFEDFIKHNEIKEQ